MEVIIADSEVLADLVEANDNLVFNDKKADQGVKLKLTNAEGTQLFFGNVHPNVQYEYETSEPGEYKLCV